MRLPPIAAKAFDVAFMDVMMPGKNGVESFLEIRRLKPAARVFMMTGYSVEELLAAGGQWRWRWACSRKPFDASEVLRLTESVGPGGVVLTLRRTGRTECGRGHCLGAARLRPQLPDDPQFRHRCPGRCVEMFW
jgi:DNA-binding NarL/FixJ family response regulator